jgi:hypothetical protein
MSALNLAFSSFTLALMLAIALFGAYDLWRAARSRRCWSPRRRRLLGWALAEFIAAFFHVSLAVPAFAFTLQAPCDFATSPFLLVTQAVR